MAGGIAVSVGLTRLLACRFCAVESSAVRTEERSRTFPVVLFHILNVIACPACSEMPTQWPRCSVGDDGNGESSTL